MEENREKENLKQEELNTEKVRKRTGHTWIGDRDEIRPDAVLRPVSRSTVTDVKPGATRVVERPRKPYTGFITDEEIRHAEAAAEIDRRARAEEQAARDRLAQTRIYTGLGSGLEGDEEPEVQEEKPARPAVRQRRTVTIRLDDAKKLRRLKALLAVLVLLVLFEISYFAMKARTASLPDSTAEVIAQTEELRAQNAEIEKETEQLGDTEEIISNRDSWQNIRDQLAE